MADTLKIFFAVFVTVVIIFIILLFLPLKLIKTTYNGEHTGIVTAVETTGLIFKTNSVYFKTSEESTQEDKYCVLDKEIKNKLMFYSKIRKVVTIKYEDYALIGIPLCDLTDISIINGVNE